MGGQLQMYSKHKHPKSHRQKPRFRSTKNVDSAHRNPLHNQQEPRYRSTKQGIALIQLTYDIGVIVVCFLLRAHYF